MAMTYVTKEAMEYRQQVAELAKAAGITEMFVGRVALDLKLYPHRPLDWATRIRKHGQNWDDTVQCIDLGNCEKVLSDALQGIVFPDDKWIWRQTKQRMEPDGDARVIVTITPIVVVAAQKELNC